VSALREGPEDIITTGSGGTVRARGFREGYGFAEVPLFTPVCAHEPDGTLTASVRTPDGSVLRFEERGASARVLKDKLLDWLTNLEVLTPEEAER